MHPPPASLLTIPCELRNQIYNYIFVLPTSSEPIDPQQHPPCDPLSASLLLLHPTCSTPHKPNPTNPLHLLQTCRKIHSEAHLLALHHANFHLSLPNLAYPPNFQALAAPLRPTKLAAIRNLTLTSRTSSLRALNETWNNLPFGTAALHLHRLTLIPTRAEARGSAYAEVADLSQSHTLAYVFAETLKGLRNVEVLEVQNRGCFNEVVWRLVYRATVYRMWRWGGWRCGVRFECGGDVESGEGWFRAWLEEGARGGRECGEEVVRLFGETGEAPGEVEEWGAV